MANKYVTGFEVSGQEYDIKDSYARTDLTSLANLIDGKLDRSVYNLKMTVVDSDLDTIKTKLNTIQQDAKNVLYADWERSTGYAPTTDSYVIPVKNKPTKLSAFEDDLTVVNHHHDSSQIDIDSTRQLSDVVNSLDGANISVEYGSVASSTDKNITPYDNDSIQIPKKFSDLEDGTELEQDESNLTYIRNKLGIDRDETEWTEERKAESEDSNGILQTDDVWAEGSISVDATTGVSTFDSEIDTTHWTELGTGEGWYEHARPNLTDLINNNLAPVNSVDSVYLKENNLGWRPPESQVVAEALDNCVKKNEKGASYYGYLHVGTADTAQTLAGEVTMEDDFTIRKTANRGDIQDYRKTIEDADTKVYKGSIESDTDIQTKLIDALPLNYGDFYNVTTDFTSTLLGCDLKQFDIVIYYGDSDIASFDKSNIRIVSDSTNARINSIRGNTIAWNQQMDNTGDTGDCWVSGYSTSTTTATTGKIDDNTINITIPKATYNSKTKTTTYSYVSLKRDTVKFRSQHKYYIAFQFVGMTSTSNFGPRFYISDSISTVDGSNYQLFNSTYKSVVTSFQEESMRNIDIGFANYSSNYEISFSIQNLMIIDLTQMFGMGNEPDSTRFSTLFPSKWYDKNIGTLIHTNLTANSKLVSESSNVFDGMYDSTSEKVVTSKLLVAPKTTYNLYFNTPSGVDSGNLIVTGYNDSGSQLYSNTLSSGSSFSTNLATEVTITIPVESSRTHDQIIENMHNLVLCRYNAYSTDITDTEHWYNPIQLVDENVTLMSAGSTYDEYADTFSASRVGKGTLKFSANDDSTFTVEFTKDSSSSDPVVGGDVMTAMGASSSIGSFISTTSFSPTVTPVTYPELSGATIDVVYASSIQTSISRTNSLDWNYKAGYNGSEIFYVDASDIEETMPSGMHYLYDDLTESGFVDHDYDTLYPTLSDHSTKSRLKKLPVYTTTPTTAPLDLEVEYEFDAGKSVSKLMDYPEIVHGRTPLVSAKAGTMSTTTISYNHRFEDVPTVTFAIQNNDQRVTLANTMIYIFNVNRDYFQVRYCNLDTNDHESTLHWTAVL